MAINNISIYLIDDNETINLVNQRIIKECIKQVSFNTFLNGLAAIKFMMSNPEEPDFVFVDIEMPVMNGWDFLNIYQDKYLALWPNAKVYLLSASLNKQDMEKSQQYLFLKGYLIKPMHKETFENIFELSSLFSQKK